MIEYININEGARWNQIISSFKDNDIYYFRDYVYPFHIIGDGDPFLLYYKSNELKGVCLLMKRPIVYDGLSLPHSLEGYFDLITPYGYGGFIFDGNIDDQTLNDFHKEYEQWLKDHKIVSVFYRFHPQLNNELFADHYCSTTYLGHTIEMNLSSQDLIWSNITSKNRNMIRKAQKNNIVIEHSKSWDIFETFIRIYNETMKKDNADSYYFFPESFYKYIYTSMADNYEIFYAKYNDMIVATSIIIFACERMHYHLSGSVLEYRNLAPSNLLLYEAAKWGCDQGFKTFHLGGGVGAKDDNLYGFKKEFNRNSDLSFYIGKQICNLEVYNQLVEFCKLHNTEFDVNSHFFPLYRN